MELFVKICRVCPSSFRELSKLTLDITDWLISIVEYLFPDFEGKAESL